jgi:hypothetical protein
MNRLPLLLSIVAVVIAVIALGLAILLPGPQGPKGDRGPQGIQGIQGIQGPPSSFLVKSTVAHYTAAVNGYFQEPSSSFVLNAGDVLEGYVSGIYDWLDYQVTLGTPSPGLGTILGSGYGGISFCYVANVTGSYDFWVRPQGYSPSSYALWHPLPFDENVTVVYWVQTGAK